jgi:molybdenum cofactor cytidylyltransferase
MNDIWAIILAAGASTRMKKQKMLLPFMDSTIIETVIQNANHAVGKNIMVVLGSHHDEIARQIQHQDVKTCSNENFMSGMLSSVICGFRALPETAKAALVFLGDQPQISGVVAKKVMDAWIKSGKGIVIPVFDGKRGHPALIETKYKIDIENLNPEKGLRSLYQKITNDINEVECNSPEILRDIDTVEDYKMEIELNK